MTDELLTIELPEAADADMILDQLGVMAKQNADIIAFLQATQGNKQYFNVKIRDFNMPFFALVGLLVKIALASIPAVIIVGTVVMFLVFFAMMVIGIGIFW